MRRLFWSSVAILCVAAGGVVGLAAWCMNAPALSSSKMEQMHAGMTESEVREWLGTPNSVYRSREGTECWAYSRFTWAIYYVYFGSDRRTVRFEHDF